MFFCVGVNIQYVGGRYFHGLVKEFGLKFRSFGAVWGVSKVMDFVCIVFILS